MIFFLGGGLELSDGAARRSARLHRSRIAIPVYRAPAQRALHAFIHSVDDWHTLRALTPCRGDSGRTEEEAFTKAPSVQRQARAPAQRHVSRYSTTYSVLISPRVLGVNSTLWCFFFNLYITEPMKTACSAVPRPHAINHMVKERSTT